jgi:hypothetical protein
MIGLFASTVGNEATSRLGFSKAATVPGAVIAVQTFGDFQKFNPHLHVISTDGCFSGNEMFRVRQSQ